MREIIDSAVSVVDLRAQLEELAADLVLGGPGSEGLEKLARQLRHLSERASSGGYRDAAEIASSVANRISQEGAGRDENLMESDLTLLRRALETSSGPSLTETRPV